MSGPRIPSRADPNSGAEAVTRNTLFNVLGQGFPLLVGLVAIPIVTHSLGDTRFGLLGLAWAILGYFSIIDFGLGIATTKLAAEYLAKDDETAVTQLVRVSTVTHLVLGISAGVFLGLLTPLLTSTVLGVPTPLIAEARTTFYLIAATLPFLFLALGFRAVLEAAQRFDLVNLIRLPSNSAIFLIPAIAAPLGVGLPGIILLLLIVRMITCWITERAMRRALPFFKWSLRVDWRSLGPLISFGKWVAVSNLLNPLLLYLDRFLLGSLAGLAAVAYYTAPFEVAVRLLIVPAGLASALFPALTLLATRDEESSLHGQVSQSVRHLVVLAGVPALLLMMFSGDLILAWLGSAYAERSTVALQILAGGIFVNSLAFVPYRCLHAVGRPDITAKFHLLELPIYVVTAWILVGRYGVSGAALAWTLRVTLDAGLLFLALWIVVGISPTRFLANNGARAVVSLAALAAVLVALTAGIPNVLPRLALAGFATLTFAVFNWYKVLTAAERVTVLGMFGREGKEGGGRREEWAES